MSKECLFQDYLATCKGDRDAYFSEISQQRMISIGEASRIIGDMLHQTLTESTLAKHFAHKNCLSTYTSNNHIQKHLKRTKKDSGKMPVKRTKISRQPFQWNRHCLIVVKNAQQKLTRKILGVGESHSSAEHLIGKKVILNNNKKGCFFLETHVFIQVIPIYFFLAVPLNTIIHFKILAPCLLKTAP